VTNVYEGEKNFALTVRWLEPFRKSVESIREITVATPDGNFIPLGQLASITLEDGPNIIFREDGFRYAPVKFSVRGRDLKSTIEDAKRQIAASPNVHLSYDTHLEWAGQINEMNDAMRRLLVIIPLTLVLIGFLTYTAVKSWMDTLVVFSNIPVACTGGVLALLVTRTNFSVSAAMGFVSIFGIAIQDAILVVTYFQRLRDVEGHSIIEAAREAAEKRFRPVLMTTLVATLGLTPAALSNGIGSQAQKPLAVVVIGGSLILAILTRVLQPPLLVMAHEWMERRRGGEPPEPLPLTDHV
jgi:cobalt-zinc-cadmium resistance protein CzcA